MLQKKNKQISAAVTPHRTAEQRRVADRRQQETRRTPRHSRNRQPSSQSSQSSSQSSNNASPLTGCRGTPPARPRHRHRLPVCACEHCSIDPAASCRAKAAVFLKGEIVRRPAVQFLMKKHGRLGVVGQTIITHVRIMYLQEVITGKTKKLPRYRTARPVEC